jgi:hypothetical protein
MAAQAAADKAAEAKAEEEAAAKAAAEQKAAEEKAAADKAAADATAKPASKPAAKAKRYVVTGAAVVLPTVDKSERYLYRNAPVDPAAFTPEGIKHALGLVLIAEVK